MELSALAGNPRIKDQLFRQEGDRGLSHAYLISGPSGSGRHTLARLLCAALVCTAPPTKRPCGQCLACRKVSEGVHPDVSVVAGPGPGKPISVDQVRALRTDAYIRPNEGERKVYVLEGADQMNASAQNAMLKLLEEGPAYAAFLLLADNSGGVLETVRSRCEGLSLAPVPLGECQSWLAARFPDKGPEEIRQAALDCQGILGRAVRRLEGGGDQESAQKVQRLARALDQEDEAGLLEQALYLEKLSREELLPALDALEEELGRRLLTAGDRGRLCRAAGLVRRLRDAALLNVNPGQLAGWLCAGMFGKDQE